ncbi:26S proteasome regulatory subunit 8 homolog A-like [Quercus robur]|uniref:26S proteasome regulatory subunit 8 homolog A-like n=1 Tax=Quercus robur TaxID=38942 RepID=UPI0021635388|nr:26S proteasome regulatory subunit 8 homolog A-like [Quercus robur]
MKVEKVPDSTYDMIGGLDQQIKEIKEVCLVIERKYVVDIDKNIDITKITPSTRVALHNDSYVLHLILPGKVDPLVNLMKVEKVPDSTYDMIGGLDQQIKEIKEAVCTESGMFGLRERRVDVTEEDFEMVVAKVMKKETEKNMSLRKLWK